MTLRTPKGAITRAPQGNQRGRASTIDHFWVTADLTTTYYGVEERGKSDHYPQVIEVNLSTEKQKNGAATEGWSWKMMDKDRVAAEAELLPYKLGAHDSGSAGLQAKIRTKEGLATAFEQLSSELVRIATVSTPKKRNSFGHGAHWWSPAVQEAITAARHAERQYKETPSLLLKAKLNRSLKAQRNAISEAKTKAWRTTLDEAAGDTKLLWRLERWARCKSHCPSEPPKLPSFTVEGQVLDTHEAKAEALGKKFFPSPAANLDDISDITFAEDFDATEKEFSLVQQVSVQEVASAIYGTRSWKAPGNDLLPTGFLKACGEPLFEVLAMLTTRCFELAFYPQEFKKARTIVLPKPGKTPAAYQTPGGYRPIALLPTLGKAIKAIMAVRVTAAAEQHGLLPDEQMGNRQHRSTEVAIRLVVAQVQEAWRQKATASLLQLDISGAFDTVNHNRLLNTLREIGFPGWTVRWIKAWLTDRKAVLHFDGQHTQAFSIRAGVPQGSPLSPILFLLYIASLYEILKAKHPHLSLVGFADDTNLLAFGKSAALNVTQLQEAWLTCLQWAETRGMSFAAEKCELVHFNKGRRQWKNAVKLSTPGPNEGQTAIEPTESCRFLGVWLDRRLSWKAHRSAIEKKLKTQDFALSRIAAKTWGPGLIRAREVYTKCIRSAIAYGASSFHVPAQAENKPKGITERLAKAQNRSLRIVAGAYKATPVRSLETETWVPPLDLYLNKRLADFETRLGIPLQGPSTNEAPKTTATIIAQACSKLARRFQLRRRKNRRVQYPQPPTDIEKATIAVNAWAAQGDTTDQALENSWEARWNHALRSLRRQIQGSTPHQPADECPLFTDQILRMHEGLTKAQSSLLVQARTGVIGLRDFLFKVKARGNPTPYCSCGRGRETVEHLVIWCPNPPKRRTWNTAEIRSRRDLYKVLHGGTKGNQMALCRAVICWLLGSGRLPEYRLAAKFQLEL